MFGSVPPAKAASAGAQKAGPGASCGGPRFQGKKGTARAPVVSVLAPVDAPVDRDKPERSPERPARNEGGLWTSAVSTLWNTATSTVGHVGPWLGTVGGYLSTERLVQYARTASVSDPRREDLAEGTAAKGNEKRSVLADVVSYLKPASTSEMRYVRMLCDLCCLTYKFHKLTPSSLMRLHRLVLITTSRACDLPLFKPSDSAHGVFAMADGMCDVPPEEPRAAAHGQMDEATAYALDRISRVPKVAARVDVTVTARPEGAPGSAAEGSPTPQGVVSVKLEEAKDAAVKAGRPLHERLAGHVSDAAGYAGSAISSTLAGILEGTSNTSFLAWQREKKESKAAAGEGAASREYSPEYPCGPDQGATLPVEWYVADDPVSQTRYVVVQGTDNLESWITNLTFEPVEFEDPRIGVIIHRGVYSVAMQLYDRLLPLVEEHLARSPFAKVCFTGHSLGGALGIALMLMYKHRGVLPAWAMAPTYTFGVASAFWDAWECSATGCHADYHGEACDRPDTSDSHGSILERFGLPEDMVRNIIMHRDIVPRAFTCDYSPVRDFMRSWGKKYSDHGPLKSASPLSGKVLMYSHIGRVFALQPHKDQVYVGQDGYHPLLPPTPGLWSFSAPTPTSRANARRHANDLRRAAAARAKPEPEFSDPGCVREAFLAFMDSPHPLEILAGPAYGVDGSISRYHNPDHYKRALGTVYAARRSALERRFSHDLKGAMRWRPAPPPKESDAAEAPDGFSQGDAAPAILDSAWDVALRPGTQGLEG